ncbi:DUF535 family protein [Massilia sp. TSP1-1-2]|uniref:DUF535 family protein n=1 Tax=Massilia sp. TSP1-1-2 TaxID=2804649 RepID=UPI003CF4F15C
MNQALPTSMIGPSTAPSAAPGAVCGGTVEKNIALSLPVIAWDASLSSAPPGLPYLRELLKLGARVAFNWRATRTWLSYWNSSLFLAQLAGAQPAILKKIYRPYLFRGLDCPQRVAALCAHYDFIVQRQLGALVALAAQAPRVLTRFTGKSGLDYRLELVAITCMEREGELVLQLCDSAAIIFSVAFTVMRAGQHHQLAVGCLQGGRAPDARERIRLATRDWHGLRPHTLLMRLIQQVGSAFACDSLVLVGNANRVMLQQIRKGRVLADYDTSWRELGALRQSDGNFALACMAPAPPDLTQIASSKRSEAKKRHHLLVSVADAACSALA